jgi:hypothetical protein
MKTKAPRRLTTAALFSQLKWIDGSLLTSYIEPYRQRIFTAVLDDVDEGGRPRFNLALTGRAKKNWKSADLVLAALFALVGNDSPGGNQCYLLANDEGQAGDDLALAKKLVAANPLLSKSLDVQRKLIVRKDRKDDSFLMILPANDVAGLHGKTYRFCGYDEIHGYKSWDLLEAMQPDPTRLDSQQWITSYASIFHRPGIPLYDLMAAGRAGRDPRMYFSWYAADFTTDPGFQELDPESRANPSRASWADGGYLAQQFARLPSHKYRRLHLNLPGLPEGSAFQPEPVMDAFARGIGSRPPEPGLVYRAFVDMSGGSDDDAVLAIGHLDPQSKRAVIDFLMNQGQPCPFDPRGAVERFARKCKEYGVSRVTGDAYGGQTFRLDFERHGIAYSVCKETTSENYESLEPRLNAREVEFVDVPVLEQQLLGLIWRGSKIDHPPGEHDDWACAVAGVVAALKSGAGVGGGVLVATQAWTRLYNQPTKETVHLGGGRFRAPNGEVFIDPRCA